jgi:glycosyltransferase involved in cell wall biosynthesis
LTVFHHMSTRSLLIVGLFYKLMGVRQGLWYSHSKKAFSLSASQILANRIFTSTPSAIPISGNRVKFVGHGLKSERFLRNDSGARQKRDGIVAIGRVVPVKKIELLVAAVSKSKLANLRITCIGPHEASGVYPNEILELARTKGIDVKLRDAIPYTEIPNALRAFDFIFTGTPKSVDKAVIEGAMCGCFVISSEEQAIKLSGMDEVFKSLGFKNTPAIENQLIAISGLPSEEKEYLRSTLSSKAAELNDLDQTTQKILIELESNL